VWLKNAVRHWNYSWFDFAIISSACHFGVSQLGLSLKQICRRRYLIKKFSLGGIVLLLGFLLAACTSKDSPTTSLDVAMTDFAYTPNAYLVPASKQITLNLQNNGAVTHQFIIMKYGTNVGTDFGPEDKPNIYWQIELVAGEGGSYAFTAPSQPGENQVVCGVSGHFMAGMAGKLTVVAP
jgi:uncharacterized cupredoxin-like copper-binding protein